jgi:hypothetical protein
MGREEAIDRQADRGVAMDDDMRQALEAMEAALKRGAITHQASHG